MSCDHNRHKYFELMQKDGHAAAELERTFQQNRRAPGNSAERLTAEAKTKMLFADMRANGLQPPTHSASGLPRSDAQVGYAAVYDALQKNGQAGDNAPDGEADLQQATQMRKADEKDKFAGLGLDGRDEEGYDRWGYDRNGYNRFGLDRDGYNANGFGPGGYNRHGYDSNGLDKKSCDPAGFNTKGVDKNGLDRKGYHPDTNLDADGYDKNGLDQDGYDRDGFDKMGFDRDGNPDPNFQAVDGIFPDGFDAYGYRKDGFDDEGYDFYGFGRDGYNRADVDRNGYGRDGGFLGLRDADGYNRSGYKRQGVYGPAQDRLGYDSDGFDEHKRGWTGFDEAGNDQDGNQRKVLNPRTGNLVNAKYDKDGFDRTGYDKHGYNTTTGLTAPDDQGRRYNTFGWLYDEKTDECFNPEEPAQRVKNEFRLKAPGRRKHKRVVSVPYRPSGPPPPITPHTKMSYDEYQAVYGPGSESFQKLPRGSISYPYPESTVAQRRAAASSAHGDKAVRDGVLMRCSHCGQFTGGNTHNCPSFAEQEVTTYRSGMVFHARTYEILWTPNNPQYDPEFDTRYRSQVGYNTAGYDRLGLDANGYDQRGFDREGYSRDGFDIFGYDRDGFDREGYNNAGFNRKNEKRGRSLKDASRLLDEEGGDQLANQDLARMYSQLATGLIGKPRRVVLQEGAGFSTDMKGTIKADPYPLGRAADARHNLVVTRAGIYHELGHEQFTSLAVWEQVLAVAEGKSGDGDLGESGRAMLPRFFNIVEDGRMERQVAGKYAGAAEILAASCRLQPRWGEEVGESVDTGEQVFWSLLYTSLPYYRVRSEVREDMSPRARALFDELSPMVARAVRAEPEEAYQVALHLAKRFEEEGLMQLPPKDYSQPMPGRGRSRDGQQGQNAEGRSGGQAGAPQEGSGQGPGRPPSGGSPEKERKGRQTGKAQEEQGGAGGKAGKQEVEGSGQGAGRPSGDDPDEERSGREPGPGGDDQDDEKKGGQPGDDQDGQTGEQAGQQGAGAGGDGEDPAPSGVADDEEDNEWLFGNEVVDAAVSAVERDAAYAIEAGVRGRSQPATIGKPLHRPLPDEPVTRQRYRDESGVPVTVAVYLPVGSGADELQKRRERHREVANLMAKPLKAIREQAELRLRRQTQGRLDRRQLVNAYKGMEDVRARTKEQPHTSFAASVQVDMSGSMSAQVKKKELYDAVMVLGDTFEMMDMPYEVRAFGSRPAQVKAMDEPFHPARAAFLAEGDLGGTQLNDTVSLARSSLLAREEKNRMMISLTDGSLHDQETTARTLRDARKNGIVTFGIFLGSQGMCDPAAMDALYGKGNWTRVEKLSDMPKSVAQRLASIFKSLR